MKKSIKSALLIAVISNAPLCADYTAIPKNETPYPIYFDFGRAGTGGCSFTRWDQPVPPGGEWEKRECPGIVFSSVSITKQHTGPTIKMTLPIPITHSWKMDQFGEKIGWQTEPGLTSISGSEDIRATAFINEGQLALKLSKWIVGSDRKSKEYWAYKTAPLTAQLTQLKNESDKTIVMSPVKFAADTTSPIAKAGDVYSNAHDPNLGQIIIITPKQTMELPAVIPPEYEGSYLQFWVGNVNGPRYTIQAMGASNEVHLRGPDENGQWTDWVFPAAATDYVLAIQANGVPTLVGPNGETRVTHFGH